MILHCVTCSSYIGFLFLKVLFNKAQPIRISYLTKGICKANPTIFQINLTKQRFSGKWDKRHESRFSKPCNIYIPYNKWSTLTETWKWIRLEGYMDCSLHNGILKYYIRVRIPKSFLRMNYFFSVQMPTFSEIVLDYSS